MNKRAITSGPGEGDAIFGQCPYCKGALTVGHICPNIVVRTQGDTNPPGKRCVTHHHACDCREAKFAELVKALEEIANHTSGDKNWAQGVAAAALVKFHCNT